MKFKATINQVSSDFIGKSIGLSLSTKDDIKTLHNELHQMATDNVEVTVEIKKYRKSRSLDSNSYAWVLCQKIAEVVHSTKEKVYQKVIRDVGQFQILPIKDEAVERWIEIWNSRGLGWYSEVMSDSKLEGYTKVISYYGSSCYSNSEMGILIDELVMTAKELGIDTMATDEIDLLKNEWGK